LAAARSLVTPLVAAVVLAGSAARADERAARFGDRGTFVFGGNLGVGGEQGLDDGYDTRVELEVDPALDVFVARRLSLGVGSVLAYSFARASPSSSLVAASPRLGVAVPLGGVFALWPRVSVDFAFETDAASVHHRIVSSTLFVPVDAFVLPHVAVGLGPALTQQLVHRVDGGTAPVTTTAQLLVELAGWL
jgi:hypothetical protein